MMAATFLIGHRRRDRKLHLSTRRDLAPELQVCSHTLRPLAHARYAPVSRNTTGRQDFWIDPLAIVTDTQAKLILVVTDFYLDVSGGGVCECIPDQFAA